MPLIARERLILKAIKICAEDLTPSSYSTTLPFSVAKYEMGISIPLNVKTYIQTIRNLIRFGLIKINQCEQHYTFETPLCSACKIVRIIK